MIGNLGQLGLGGDCVMPRMYKSVSQVTIKWGWFKSGKEVNQTLFPSLKCVKCFVVVISSRLAL